MHLWSLRSACSNVAVGCGKEPSDSQNKICLSTHPQLKRFKGTLWKHLRSQYDKNKRCSIGFRSGECGGQSRQQSEKMRREHESSWFDATTDLIEFLWSFIVHPSCEYQINIFVFLEMLQRSWSSHNNLVLMAQPYTSPYLRLLNLDIYCCYGMRVKVKLTEVQFSKPLDVTLVMLWFHIYVQTELLWEGIIVKGRGSGVKVHLPH